MLQHPQEASQAKGSARLLHLSLARSQLHTGEIFAPAVLQALLQRPWPEAMDAAPSGTANHTPVHSILLYPRPPTDVAPAPLPLAEPARLRLVLLDGTWRQSRRMLQDNPLLQALPRLALPSSLPSRYHIRRAQRPGQLSTLEACCHALRQLEQREQPYQSLLQAFDGFVAQQLAYRPQATTGN
ncbi:MAG TPA: tRNA-uridine aminocarboxypropyltransferase [Burkholderiaceae bacterium]|nr:tRNA-uridine aminocarboxypropyltransferase [Burkholderiaceae bacterium]